MEVKIPKIRELKALLSMLDEPDDDLFINICSGIEQYGIEAVHYLEDFADDFLNPLVKERAENIIRNIRLNKAIIDIKDWKLSEKHDILQAWIVIEQLLFPDYDYDIVKEKFEHILREIWLSLQINSDPIQKIKNINYNLYNVLNFKVTGGIVFDNSFILNRIMESYTGNYVTSSMLYLVLTQKLNYPVFGQMIRNSFVLSWINTKNNEDYIPYLDEKRVLFYISPFINGEIFDDNQINEFLKINNISINPSFFKPINNIDVIAFYIKHLINAVNEKKMDVTANELKSVLMIIEK